MGKVLLILISLVFLGILFAIVFITPKDDTNILFVLLIQCAVMIPVIMLMWTSRLTTRIDDLTVSYKYTPYNWNQKIFRWSDIEQFELRTYSPISEYGGYGYRKNFFKKKTCVSVSGKTGLELHLKNGKKIMIGTQREADIKTFLNKLEEKKIG